jgi:DNA modification methylase
LNVVLPVKPKYVEKIIKGGKKYELRKTLFKATSEDKIYIYAMSPIKKIVGYFRIGNIIKGNPEELWQSINTLSGLEHDEFINYFKNNETGYAIEINNLVTFDNPIVPQNIIDNFSPPRSFIYTNVDMPIMLTNKKDKTKLLNIKNNKTCECPDNHINCLTPKEWIQSQVAIWEFYYEKRDVRDKTIHPASFPISLPAKFIKLFTHEGELVIDPFAGIGSTLVAAQDLNRNAVGFDLKKEYVEVAKKRLAQANFLNSAEQIMVNDDARNIPNYFEGETISLVVTSPPYSQFLAKPKLNKSMRGDLRNNKHYLNVQQYSQDTNDIGNLEPITFSKALAEIFKGILPILKPKAHCVIDINDLWWENKRIPTHVYIIQEMMNVGYDLRNVLIWDRRNLVNRVGIFGWPNNYIKLGTTFEYLLDFWKPPR